MATDDTNAWNRIGDLDVQGQCGLDHDIGCDEFVQLPTPILEPTHCATFHFPTSVVVRADSRSDAHVARVHVTTDGSLPETDDPAVAPGARVAISNDCMFTAVSVSDEDWVWPSAPARATFLHPTLLLVHLSGYVWAANEGWISLANDQARVQTATLDLGPDTDVDGIPDTWEYARTGQLDRLHGGGADWDGDGVSDADEAVADTDPCDVNERFATRTHRCTPIRAMFSHVSISHRP